MKKLQYWIILIVVFVMLKADEVNFTSSNLPIVILNTNGKTIPDEPKITAQMKIIWNDDGSRNYVTDTNFNYNGLIGIEMRGSSSQYYFPKKQYAVETRDSDGENLNVPLMGLPEENDWILHAPYSDKTLMRNVLAYALHEKMGWYASRCRFCELVLNGQYQGVYILMEKIKRDDNRVDINKLKEDEISGDDLPGGYIIKIDKDTGDNNGGWTSNYPPKEGSHFNINYQYHIPKNDDIVEEQRQYIQGKVDYFETIMSRSDYDNSETGYPSIINSESFIDFSLMNELAKNVDGFRLSTFLYKDKDSNDPRFYAGPIWDFNLGFGNANYYQGQYNSEWMLDIFYNDSWFLTDDHQPPFYWRKLWYCQTYRKQAENRWNELRNGVLSTQYIFGMIDSIATLLDEAQDRNYQRWDEVLGEYIWPNPSGFENRRTYQSEINYMKSWISGRLSWMDHNIAHPDDVAIDPKYENLISDFELFENYPNPFNPTTSIQFKIPDNKFVSLKIFDIKGNLIETIFEGYLSQGIHNYQFDGNIISSGVYIYQLEYDGIIKTGKALLIK